MCCRSPTPLEPWLRMQMRCESSRKGRRKGAARALRGAQGAGSPPSTALDSSSRRARSGDASGRRACRGAAAGSEDAPPPAEAGWDAIKEATAGSWRSNLHLNIRRSPPERLNISVAPTTAADCAPHLRPSGQQV